MTLTSFMTVLIVLWLAMVGSAVGSFLNVVVYRLPRGMSLSRPGSHCPKCGHPIRWHDNVPVLAWLYLRGRCRDCHAPISARYPTVEAICGLVFLAIGWREIVLGGANLPLRLALVPDGQVYPQYTDQQLVLTAALHAVLMATLLAATLIEWDGHAVPVRLFGLTAALGLVLPAFFPTVHPVPVFSGPAGSTTWIGLIESVAGGFVGFGLGRLVGRLLKETSPYAFPLALMSVGLLVGAQAVLAIAVLAAVLGGIGGLLTRGRRSCLQLALFLVTLGWLLFWNTWIDLWPFPG